MIQEHLDALDAAGYEVEIIKRCDPNDGHCYQCCTYHGGHGLDSLWECESCRVKRLLRNESAYQEKLDRRDARLREGTVCLGRRSNGEPCSGTPIRATDRCSHHTDDPQVRIAKDMGIAYGKMALTWNDLLAAIRPLHPSIRDIVAAYAFDYVRASWTTAAHALYDDSDPLVPDR